MRARGWAICFVVSQLACFVQGDTSGLPCTEDEACFNGQVCGTAGVCVEAFMVDDSTTAPYGDGDDDPTEPGDGDADTTAAGDGDPSESGDGDQTESDDGDDDPSEDGDGDGDGDPTESGDGDGDGDPVPECGDGIAQSSENCDGMDLKGKTCSDFGYGGGMLACNDCTLSFAGCCQGTGQSCASKGCCAGLTCSLLPLLVCQ
ncbi:hypothetical protein [Enhygromyxa salina]|uniref:Endo-1,4-beta-xylanase A n=1 Tax=Enhygromyxa salina TaxID=215803 RepID=A0A2S9Y837_9BACT|nr:hypothetical protein [Enhygromyxa salina]PRQ01186.1 hypothetical protein ENSA7_57910 [Enhygromyxa salina]